MKSFCMVGRRALASILCISLLSVNAFAADKEEDKPLRKITYDEAVQMVLDNNTSLTDLAEKIEYIQDNKDYITQDMGGGNMPDYEGSQTVVESTRLANLSRINSYDVGIESAKLSKELTEIGAGATVKQYFRTIQINEINLETLEESLAIQRQLLSQGRTKQNLGLMSDKDFEQLQRDTKDMEQNLKMLELKIENDYLQLNDLLGLQPEERYLIDNPIEYAPLKMTTTLDTHVSRQMSMDQGLKMQELAVKDAKFTMNVFSVSSEPSDYRTNEYNYENAERTYKEARRQKELDIRAAYTNIQQLEETRATLVSALDKAKATYETAKVNYEVGNITKLALDQAALAISAAETDLRENELNHDMLLYTFSHSSLLGGSGA